MRADPVRGLCEPPRALTGEVAESDLAAGRGLLPLNLSGRFPPKEGEDRASAVERIFAT